MERASQTATGVDHQYAPLKDMHLEEALKSIKGVVAAFEQDVRY